MKNKWETEPDNKEFKYRGMECLILRNMNLKHLCGYVRIPKDSVLANKSYDDIDVEVHGGLTFFGEHKNREGIWLGFDCAHSGDLSPGISSLHKFSMEDIYRDMEYVEKEIKSRVDQLRKGVKVRVDSYKTIRLGKEEMRK